MLLLDTSIVVLIRDGDADLIRWLADKGEPLTMSLMTMVELEGGIAAVPALAERRRTGMQTILENVKVLDFDQGVVDAYAEILRRTGYSRRRIIDRLIAATALVHALPLATTNPADFRDIPDLALEVWPTAQ